jgi:serine/threonine protein kinase
MSETSAEKRQARRLKSALKAEGKFQDKLFPVWCFDFSPKGFGCYLPPNFPGSEFELLFSLDAPRDFGFRLLIRHREPAQFNGQNCLKAGGTISGYPPEPKVFFQKLAARFQDLQAQERQEATTLERKLEETTAGGVIGSPTSKIERRHDRRFPCQAPAFVRLDEKAYRLVLMDISKRGLAVEGPADFPTRGRFELLLQPSDSAPMRLEVVEKCRELVQTKNELHVRLGLKIVRMDEAYGDFVRHISQPGEPEEITKTVAMEQVELRRPDTLPTLTEQDGSTSESGSLLGHVRYTFERRLGKGGFAEVYLVRDVALNRLVAMKVLSAQFAKDGKLAYRFLAEAQIAAQFQHPNIATVFEVGEIRSEKFREQLDFPAEVLGKYPERMVYFTMQFIQGKSLAEILKVEGKVPIDRALFYLHSSALALEYAHLKGVVHRDIKPENIMVTEDHRVLVTDFGIAKVLSRREDTDPGVVVDREQDKTQGFMGTPIYASPEQITSGGVDNRSDLYSLGVAAYELLSGKPPFKGSTWMETIALHLQKDPVPLLELDAQITQNLSDLVMKLLAKNPVMRYQNARTLAEDLAKVRDYYKAPDLQISATTDIDADTLEQVKQIFIQFSKTYRIIGTYPEKHDMVTRAASELHNRFSTVLEKHERLDFRVESMGLFFHRQEVLSEDQKENSLVFNLFRDGIRSLFFFRGLTLEELHTFMLRLFRYVSDRKSFEEDSVTILFQLGLQTIDFEYVDSFYEDVDSVRRLKSMEEEAYRDRVFSLEELEAAAVPMDPFLSWYGQLEVHVKKLSLGQLQKHFDEQLEPAMRREGTRILLHLLHEEAPGSVFDQEFHILEEVLFSNLNQNDLDLVVHILEELGDWAKASSDDDPRNLPARLLKLKERLSQEALLVELVDKFFYVDRLLRDPIRQICRFLLPAQAVKLLFQRFKLEEEEWKQLFLGELCVTASGATLTPLVQMAMDLSDESASNLLSGFSKAQVTMSRSLLSSWLQHPGPQTRARLARLAAAVPDGREILVRMASDPSPKQAEARAIAWQYLAQKDKATHSKVVAGFLSIDTYVNQGGAERRMLLDLARELAGAQAVTFLAEVLAESHALSGDRVPLEEKTLAANYLAELGGDDAWEAIRKIAKRLLGNRHLQQHCKQLLESRT